MWYKEIDDGVSSTKHLDYKFLDSEFVLDPDRWIEFMVHSIKNPYFLEGRRVMHVDILASGGSLVWSEYLQEADWTYDLLTYPKSNVSGGLGFLGSRASGALYEYELDQQFLDTLMLSERTRSLLFVH